MHSRLNRYTSAILSAGLFLCTVMKEMLDNQTIEDLEFNAIRERLSSFCYGATASVRMRSLLPCKRREDAEEAMDSASEMLELQSSQEGFPRLDFEEISEDLHRLSVKGGILALEGFVRVMDASRLINDILTFLKPRQDSAPNLFSLATRANFTLDIIRPIEKVLDKRIQVKDDASSNLLKIRTELKRCRNEINRNFEKVVRKLSKDGVIGDTVETYINNRRVLSILSNYKRQVPGNVVGASKTGNLTYIEPRENMLLNNEVEMLLDDERNEIRRIFLALSDELRRHFELLKTYQLVLSDLDFVNANARFAKQIGGTRPALLDEPQVELIDAYHPLLLLANKEADKKTIPQSLFMDKFCRMMVISGPNAGGKSITLKTVGLLQIMVQSGLLVPCDPSSKFGWFHLLLSDIGDNQSIVNQLSTYSYRLQRMKLFLALANKRTLLLLDEFGTGSDPELGGALAEVCFETLYNRKSFGVITTHYANIKLKAARLKNAINACMLFNSSTLEPMYQLSVGQPGSSFTFEVAQVNGLPQDLIQEAKTRLDANKVEMDQLIATLQKEKSEIEELNATSRAAIEEADDAKETYEALSDNLEQKLIKQQELIERNNKALSNGLKMQQFIQSYRMKGQNKKLLEEVRKFLAIEKSKLLKKNEQSKASQAKHESRPALNREKLKQKQKPTQKPVKPVLIGSSVCMKSGTTVGEVIEIKGDEAIVLFGNFKTKVELSQLEVR